MTRLQRTLWAAWKKCTTRPVWWWERRRPRPIVDSWRSLSPVRVGGGAPGCVAVLGTGATWRESLWSAWSLARFLGGDVAVTLYIDGEIDARVGRAADWLLPGANIVEARAYLQAHPSCAGAARRFLDHHPMAVKYLLGLTLQRYAPTLYMDNDILFFREPAELSGALLGGGSEGPLHICESGAGAWDPWALERVRARGLTPARSFNGGLLWMPRDCLDVDLAIGLLDGWQPPARSWFTEQTLNAALFERAGSRGLPRGRYVIDNARQFYWERDVDYGSVVARHFTGPVRHVMVGAGYRHLLQAGREPRCARDGRGDGR